MDGGGIYPVTQTTVRELCGLLDKANPELGNQLGNDME